MKLRLTLSFSLLTIALASCAPERPKPSAPLHTVGPVVAPIGCQELRKRGGSC